MWSKPIKKTVFTLNVDNYSPAITQLTYPLIEAWARKIGADLYTIKERKFPDFAPVYEKLQIHELGQKMQNDWNIYIDSDALIHPDFFDPTLYLSKDTILHNGVDMAGNRWTYDQYFRRDGRNIGSCNWFTIGSDWCLDLWKPLDDLTQAQALANIHPIMLEHNTVITRNHLIDDYTLSRNVAKFGLKATTMIQLLEKIGQGGFNYLWHQYVLNEEKKLEEMCRCILNWHLISLDKKDEEKKEVFAKFDKADIKIKVSDAIQIRDSWLVKINSGL